MIPQHFCKNRVLLFVNLIYITLYSNSAFIQLAYSGALAVLYFHKFMQILLFKAQGFLNVSKYVNDGVADRAQKGKQYQKIIPALIHRCFICLNYLFICAYFGRVYICNQSPSQFFFKLLITLHSSIKVDELQRKNPDIFRGFIHWGEEVGAISLGLYNTHLVPVFCKFPSIIPVLCNCYKELFKNDFVWKEP